LAVSLALVIARTDRPITAAETGAADAQAGAAGENGGNGMGGGRGTGGGTHGGEGGGGKDKTANAPVKLETIKGEVTQVDGPGAGSGDGKNRGSGGKRPGPMITVRTETETLSVHAGAPHFRQEQKLELKVGDIIEVRGVRATKTPGMFIAHSITRGSQVVRLRDEQGQKLWKPRQRTQEPTLTELKARVVSVDATAEHNPGSGLGRTSQFIIVRAGQEDLAIEVGPDEYRQSQGLTLKADDEIAISGWRLPSAQTAGKPIVLAASITKGKTVVKLRDDRRRPVWIKKK
jgi:hypothetical protein